MKQKLLIGTNNPGKIKRWSSYFGDMFDIVSLKDCNINYEVEESMDDLKGNAIKKATTYSQMSGYLTLSEDTGFFITELNGLPGIAVRRWGGELSNNVSDEEFLEFFKQKVKNLDNLESYFEYEVVIALPNGEYTNINRKAYGYIDKNRLEKIKGHEGGYPLSNCFVNQIDNKTWYECTDEERKFRDEEIIKEIRIIFDTYQKHNKIIL